MFSFHKSSCIFFKYFLSILQHVLLEPFSLYLVLQKAGTTKQEPTYITPSKIDKGKFSWKPSLANSQLSDSQGSEFNSQESLGRQNSQDHKSSGGQPQASTQMWVDKYKPNNSKQIIGQQGDRSNAKKLTKWLQKWHDNNFGPNKDKG